MMLDMKRTFDEVVESQASPEKARQILENPFYVALSSSFAGTQEYMAMEKLGQLHARRPPRRHLRPDRRRHPAVALGAGLPRRARAALELPRRPVHPAAAGAGAGPGPADDGRARPDHQRARPRSSAPRCCATCRPSWRPSTRSSAASASAPQKTFAAAPGRRHGVPRRGRARAGRAARGGVLRRAAQRGPDAAGRAGRQPGQPRAHRRALAPTRRWRRPRGCASASPDVA